MSTRLAGVPTLAMALALSLGAGPRVGLSAAAAAIPAKEPLAMDDENELSVDASVQGQGDQSRLVFRWTNHGARSWLLLTHVETDAGLMFDAIEIMQGAVRTALKSPRKSAAPRFCILPAGQSHELRIGPLKPRLLRLGLDARLPWRADYVVAPHVQAPVLAAPLCAGAESELPVQQGPGSHDPAAPLWRGRAVGPVLHL